ncbi:MAG TPA: hypothetical protein VMG12_36015 [Polyangiaceae bacterium]|nr:hypothetical protein [Polyangiaceae bacterium]
MAVALVPALVAVLQLGRVHPDEVYQALEPAYWRAFGYGVLSWEWQVGLRNWAVPGLLSGLLRASAALGISHPRAYRAVLELPQLVLHAASLAAVFVYARRRLRHELAVWAVLAIGLFGPVITFAGRTLSESLSTSFLLIACALLDGFARGPAGTRASGDAALEAAEPPRWHAFAAGGALGLAVVTRYPSAVFVAVALGWLIVRRNARAFVGVLLGGASIALLLALLDAATWGRPFHSLLTYLDFNVLSGQAGRSYGRKPLGYYLGRLLLWAPIWAWPGIVWAARRQAPRLPLPALLALVYAVVISVTPHKEPRFAYPALVLFALAAAPGVLGFIEQLPRARLRRWAPALMVALSFAPYLFRTPLDAERGDEFRAIVRATRSDVSRADATGLLLANEGPWGAGGYFYMGKNIPWLASEKATDAAFVTALDDPKYNRALSYDDVALEALGRAGFRLTERVGRASIFERDTAGAPR